MVQVGSAAITAVLSCRLLAQFRGCKGAGHTDPSPMAHEDGSRAERSVVHRLRCHGREPRRPASETFAIGSSTRMDRNRANLSRKFGFSRVESRSTRDLFHDLSLRQLANEPLTYGVAAWLIVAYLAFMMRQDLAYEWARLLRAVGEPGWGSYTRAYRPENEEVISTRIRSRIAQWIAQMNGPLKWANLTAVINRRSGLDNTINSETSNCGDRPASTGVQTEVPTAGQLPDPLPLCSPESPSHRRTIFPGSSSSDFAHSQSKPWDESEWID
jgi:hypothetical protein